VREFLRAVGKIEEGGAESHRKTCIKNQNQDQKLLFGRERRFSGLQILFHF
jgi:hypothetical protein